MKHQDSIYFKTYILYLASLIVLTGKIYSQEYFSFFNWPNGQLTATNWRSDPNPIQFGSYTGCLYADISISNSAAAWQTSNPRYAYSSMGMPASDGYGMRLGVDWANTSQVVTYTITFKSSSGGPVTEYPVEFSLYDINAHVCGAIAANRFIDVVSVVGYRQNLSTVVNPSYANAANSGGTTCTSNSISGNWITGSGNCALNRTNVTFPSNVARIVITYTTGIGHPAALNCGTNPNALIAGDNPRAQEIAFSPFKINNPGTPTAPTAITGGSSLCSGNSITLTGTGATSTSRWYTGSCGGTLIGTGSSITESPTSNTTYYVANVGGLCGTTLSSCASVAVTVTSPPTISSQPTSTSTCSTGSATVSINASSGPYQWQYFNGSTWNNVVNGVPTGFTYANETTNNLSITTSGAATGVYQYRCVVGSSCTLNSSTANVTITGPATTGMSSGDWVWTGAQSIIYELAGNWLSWNGTSLSVPANPPTTSSNVRIKPTSGCVLRQPTVTNSITIADATGSANCRDIVIETGATLTFTNTALPNNAHLHITGNYNNQGTVVPGTGRVKFVRNSGIQTITDASGTATFYEMNVASTSTVILNNNVTVTNAIRLSGVISTGTNRVYLNTTSIDDGSTTGFVTYTGHVFGNLRRRVVTNTNSYYFPVGVSNVLNTGRRLLEWMNNNTTGITDLDCSVSNTFKGTGNNIDAQLDVANKAKSFAQVMDFVRPEAEWTLTPNTAITGGNYGLRLYLQNFAAIPDNKFTIMKRPDASTTFFDFNTFYLTTTIPAVNNAGRIYNSGNGYAEKTGFTAFSKFVVATSADILPIELKNYNIECAKNKAVLSWQTASETNNHYFTIWRSDDGVNYDSLAFVYGAGNSSQSNTYTWTDNFLNDVSSNSYYYYKISQTDFSGEKKYFPAKFFDKFCGLGVFPNPIFDRGTLVFYLNGTSKVSATLYNGLGQLVREYFIGQSFENGSHLSELNMDGISSGIYYLNVNIKNDINILKISVQKE